MSEHVVSPRVYVGVFAVLMVLTTVTVAISRIHLGALNAPVAVSIAVVKATLVILYFMHVRYSPRLTWLVVGAAFLWLALMLSGTVSDYMSRGRVNPAGRPAQPAVLEDR